ncbi:MAG: D-2-hydroxyacid dehydrogenase [Oscillospiraceae bacterium]|nr:D-2-hydroxyacid dehydrogenase [Oscillospiraceae bacterium]
MKIVIPDWSTMSAVNMGFSAFEEFGEVICCGMTQPEEAAEKIGDAEIVLVNKTPITAEVMDKCPNLQYIGLFATGYNNIDIAAATVHGITVCNAGEYSTQAVVQHTFALLLSLAGNLRKYETAVADGAWERSETFSYFPYPVHELYGKTFAVIGYGSIGKGVAKVAAAFGMQVIVNTRTQPLDCPYELVTQEEAFRRADVLSVHCPLTEKTANLICAENLALMKPTAYLLNTARGGIVDEQALAAALNEGRLAGAGVDVLIKEPMDGATPLKTAKNCIITPHIAWSALETRERLIGIVADNLRNYLEGHPTNRVN